MVDGRRKSCTQAKKLFLKNDIKIIFCGKRDLGPVIGFDSWRDKYMNEKVNFWVKEVSNVI